MTYVPDHKQFLIELSNGNIARSSVLRVEQNTWSCGITFISEPEDKREPSAVAQNIRDKEVKIFYKENTALILEKEHCLTYLQSSMFATVLEDTLNGLRILAECNNELRIHKTKTDIPLLLAMKFNVKQPDTTDELDGIDHQNLGCMEYKLKKLVADRKYLANVMISTYTELALHNSFQCLVGFVNQAVHRNDHLPLLCEDEAKNKIVRRDLSKQLRQQRNHIKSVIYDTDVKIDDLKSRVEDSVLYSECRSRYVDNWQLARTEQHLQTIKDKETIPSESIELYKRKNELEQRIHSEIELLINISINDTLQKVDDWMTKYDIDMEAIDLKIQYKKNDYQNMLDKRVELETTIEKHDTLIKDWKQFKEEREKARQYHDKMTKSAITVQAWWRGLIVRRQLGPYKIVKNKGLSVGAARKKNVS